LYRNYYPKDRLSGIKQYFDKDAVKFCHDRWRSGLAARLDRRNHYLFVKSCMPSGVKVDTFLDVGAGPGEWARVLSKHCKKYIALDISTKMLASSFYSLLPNCIKANATATDLPIPDNSIDFILCSHVLEYQDDSSACLVEFSRVLKKNGRLILITKNRHALVWRATQSILTLFKRNPIPKQIWHRIETIGFPKNMMIESIAYISARLPLNPNDVHDGFKPRFKNSIPMYFGNCTEQNIVGRLLGWHVGILAIKSNR